MEMNWKEKYLGRFISINFTEDDVGTCIESIVKSLNRFGESLKVSGNITYNNQCIYLRDCNISYKIEENRIDFTKTGKNSSALIGSASIIKNENQVNLFSNYCKLDKSLELIDFNLCQAIDEVIGCLLIQYK